MRKRRFAVGLLCAALLLGSAAAASNIISKTIAVQYMDIKLVVDGVRVIPKDANGTVVEPFVYNGTTYLPVRAIGETLGKEVDWEGNTKTVYIGKIPGKVAANYLEPYQGTDYSYYSGDSANYFSMMGKKYTQGLFLRGWNGASGLFNLDGKYASIEFDLGHIDNDGAGSATIYFYVDGKLVQEIEVSGEMQTKHISIPVNYGLQLKIEKGNFDYHNAVYGLANLVGID